MSCRRAVPRHDAPPWGAATHTQWESVGAPVVIDTNVALDLLVFGEPQAAALAQALAQGRWRWIATVAMRNEFQRVLGYPRLVRWMAHHGITVAAALAGFDDGVQIVDAPDTAPDAPQCADADDQMFVDLALAHHCPLISKDQAVLALRGRHASAPGGGGSVGLDARALDDVLPDGLLAGHEGRVVG